MKKIFNILKSIILENGLIYYNSNNLSLMEYLNKKKYLIIFVLCVCLIFSFKITLLLIGSILVFGFTGRLIFKLLNLNKDTKTKNFWLGK